MLAGRYILLLIFAWGVSSAKVTVHPSEQNKHPSTITTPFNKKLSTFALIPHTEYKGEKEENAEKRIGCLRKGNLYVSHSTSKKIFPYLPEGSHPEKTNFTAKLHLIHHKLNI